MTNLRLRRPRQSPGVHPSAGALHIAEMGMDRLTPILFRLLVDRTATRAATRRRFSHQDVTGTARQFHGKQLRKMSLHYSCWSSVTACGHSSRWHWPR